MTEPGHFTTEEIVDNLSEALWECEYSEEHNEAVWLSFWDRLLEGGGAPAMPVEEGQ